jgi:hypothetical protein
MHAVGGLYFRAERAVASCSWKKENTARQMHAVLAMNFKVGRFTSGSVQFLQ